MGEAGPYLFIGIQIAGAMALFVLGGIFADRWLGTSPWLLILGMILGMVAVVGTVVRAAQHLDAQNRRRKGQPPGERQ
jgi:F0F1-type ATP synthase assembly protein I